MNDYNSIFKNEIKNRLEDESWDLFISGEVLKSIRLKKEKNLFRGYVASLVTAALFLIIFIFNIYSFYLNKNQDYSNELYSYGTAIYSINTEEIDLMINEAFPMR